MKTPVRPKKPVSRPVAAAVPKTCPHHWIIEPPNGAVSIGKCKVCSESREFRNSYEYSSWYGSKNTDKPGAPKQAAAPKA